MTSVLPETLMHSKTLRLFILPTLALLTTTVGCTNAAPVDEASDTPDAETQGESEGDSLAAITYWQDVAPIYYESCVSCHRGGGIGPFPLDDYQSAAAWASASAMAVENRVMPPWLVTDDGTCNEWQHSPVLSQEQIDTIVAWVDEGAPEGTARDDLELPELEGLIGTITLTTPEFVPEPAGGLFAQYDEYRCFLVDPGFDHDVYLTGYEATPGNDALVHHMVAMPVDPNLVVDGNQTNLQVMQAHDDESPDRLGWPCLGAAGEGVAIEGLPVIWAPGQGVVKLPADSGTSWSFRSTTTCSTRR
jgi:mono/diheme cytochrome c family protein